VAIPRPKGRMATKVAFCKKATQDELLKQKLGQGGRR
jgi:hypothetical protein